MTAINVFLRRDRAIMMTDASMYDREGIVRFHGQKAFAIPSLNAVVAVRGAQRATPMLAIEMSAAYRDFDQMADAAATDLDGWFSNNVMALADTGHQDIQIVVAGWSKRQNAPVGYWYDSTDDGFQMMEYGWAIGPEPSDFEDERLHAQRCEPVRDYDVVDFDPIHHGIPLMEAQRRTAVDTLGIGGGGPMHVVGGHILLTEVTRDGVSQRVIHRWADELNTKIQPEPYATSSAAGMSRQQRRAMARQMARAS